MAVVKVVYIYNLKEGVDPKEFENYYFNQRIPQVMQVPNLKKFCFNVATGDDPAPYRYMAENYYKDLKTAKETLNSDYFKDVHGYIADKLADMEVMFYETHEWIPAEWQE
jgi:uncharacterized protein (TIGR02118 family)